MGAWTTHGGPLFNLFFPFWSWEAGPPGWWCHPLFLQDPQSLSLTLLGDSDQAEESCLPIHPFVEVVGVLVGGCRAEGGLWPHRGPSLEGRTSTLLLSAWAPTTDIWAIRKFLPTSHHTHCQKGKEQRQWQQQSEPFWDTGPNGSWLGAPARPGHSLGPRTPEQLTACPVPLPLFHSKSDLLTAPRFRHTHTHTCALAFQPSA